MFTLSRSVSKITLMMDHPLILLFFFLHLDKCGGECQLWGSLIPSSDTKQVPGLFFKFK